MGFGGWAAPSSEHHVLQADLDVEDGTSDGSRDAHPVLRAGPCVARPGCRARRPFGAKDQEPGRRCCWPSLLGDAEDGAPAHGRIPCGALYRGA